ncbi:Membrane protein [Novosphingobium resinovorum]|jgi:murein DD-endopeptidase MepM/ murein hydrolase activator NlpD|uniref:Membrane protein n=1 Tax=Novosphingobium resinovorum TaxID=158500 RepID=A0A031K340_9SPHN|nr:LysM peptidoglycan-binding domain-containing M23 family metallopeptidase [Novosphingobium resinovorum]EZP83665.1 Membrane protein [Novosphingobium resinovorum]
MKRALFLAAALASTPAYAAAPKEEETVHVVASGETLNGIANRAGVSTSAIVKANALKEPYVVRVGQKLAIPRDGKAAQVARAADTAAPAAKKVATAARVIEARTPAAAGAPEYETEHLVATGETLGGIAARAKVPRILIAEANGLQPPYDVRVGQTLRIPRTGRHLVKAGETAFSISMDTAVPWEQIALANNLDPAAPVKPGQNLLIPTLIEPPKGAAKTIVPAPKPVVAAPAPRSARFAWPLAGTVRRGYTTGSDYHDGIDIPAAKGTMVRAAAAGTVKFAGAEKNQFGNLVVLDHGDGWFTAYGFLSRVTVKEGAKVAAGERVGLVGDTGRAKGSELHFEVRQDGQPVDPLGQLPKAP